MSKNSDRSNAASGTSRNSQSKIPVKYRGRMRLTDIQYTTDLEDQDSASFKDIRTDFEKAVGIGNFRC